MARNIQENFKKIKDTAKESSDGRTEESMKVNGSEENNTE